MVSNTKEQALEAAIELALTGTTSEAIKAASNDRGIAETPSDYITGEQRFARGLPSDFTAQYAIDKRFFGGLLIKHKKMS